MHALHALRVDIFPWIKNILARKARTFVTFYGHCEKKATSSRSVLKNPYFGLFITRIRIEKSRITP